MYKLKEWLNKPWNSYLLDNFNYAYEKIIKNFLAISEKYKKDFYENNTRQEFDNLIYYPFYEYFLSRHPEWNVNFNDFMKAVKSKIKPDFKDYELHYNSNEYLLDKTNLIVAFLSEEQLVEYLFKSSPYMKIDKYENKNYHLLIDEDFDVFQHKVAKLLDELIKKMRRHSDKNSENPVEKMIHAIQTINFFSHKFLSIYLDNEKLKRIISGKLGYFDVIGLVLGSVK